MWMDGWMDNFYLRLNRKYKHRYEQCLLWTLLGACTVSPTGETMGQLESWLHATPARIVRQTDIENTQNSYSFSLQNTFCIYNFASFIECIYFKLGCSFNIFWLIINLNFSLAGNSWKFAGIFSVFIHNLLRSSCNPHGK